MFFCSKRCYGELKLVKYDDQIEANLVRCAKCGQEYWIDTKVWEKEKDWVQDRLAFKRE